MLRLNSPSYGSISFLSGCIPYLCLYTVEKGVNINWSCTRYIAVAFDCVLSNAPTSSNKVLQTGSLVLVLVSRFTQNYLNCFAINLNTSSGKFHADS